MQVRPFATVVVVVVVVVIVVVVVVVVVVADVVAVAAVAAAAVVVVVVVDVGGDGGIRVTSLSAYFNASSELSIARSAASDLHSASGGYKRVTAVTKVTATAA